MRKFSPLALFQEIHCTPRIPRDVGTPVVCATGFWSCLECLPHLLGNYRDIVLLPALSFLFPGKTKTVALPGKDQERADESYLVDSAFYLSPQHSDEL